MSSFGGQLLHSASLLVLQLCQVAGEQVFEVSFRPASPIYPALLRFTNSQTIPEVPMSFSNARSLWRPVMQCSRVAECFPVVHTFSGVCFPFLQQAASWGSHGLEPLFANAGGGFHWIYWLDS